MTGWPVEPMFHRPPFCYARMEGKPMSVEIMAYDDFREGDSFSIDFRMKGQMEGVWHGMGESATLDEACAAFDTLIAADRTEGARPGARWRMCHMRGHEIIRVIEDMTLTKDGLATTPNERC